MSFKMQREETIELILTTLKSPSISESSQISSWGTFLLFRRCSSLLFCKRKMMEHLENLDFGEVRVLRNPPSLRFKFSKITWEGLHREIWEFFLKISCTQLVLEVWCAQIHPYSNLFVIISTRTQQFPEVFWSAQGKNNSSCDSFVPTIPVLPSHSSTFVRK